MKVVYPTHHKNRSLQRRASQPITWQSTKETKPNMCSNKSKHTTSQNKHKKTKARFGHLEWCLACSDVRITSVETVWFSYLNRTVPHFVTAWRLWLQPIFTYLHVLPVVSHVWRHLALSVDSVCNRKRSLVHQYFDKIDLQIYDLQMYGIQTLEWHSGSGPSIAIYGTSP